MFYITRQGARAFEVTAWILRLYTVGLILRYVLRTHICKEDINQPPMQSLFDFINFVISLYGGWRMFNAARHLGCDAGCGEGFTILLLSCLMQCPWVGVEMARECFDHFFVVVAKIINRERANDPYHSFLHRCSRVRTLFILSKAQAYDLAGITIVYMYNGKGICASQFLSSMNRFTASERDVEMSMALYMYWRHVIKTPTLEIFANSQVSPEHWRGFMERSDWLEQNTHTPTMLPANTLVGPTGHFWRFHDLGSYQFQASIAHLYIYWRPDLVSMRYISPPGPICVNPLIASKYNLLRTQASQGRALFIDDNSIPALPTGARGVSRQLSLPPGNGST